MSEPTPDYSVTYFPASEQVKDRPPNVAYVETLEQAIDIVWTMSQFRGSWSPIDIRYKHEVLFDRETLLALMEDIKASLDAGNFIKKFAKKYLSPSRSVPL